MSNVKRVIYNKYDKKEIFKDYNSLVKHNNLIQFTYHLVNLKTNLFNKNCSFLNKLNIENQNYYISYFINYLYTFYLIYISIFNLYKTY